MSATVPKTMRALITQPEKKAVVKEVPVPSITDDEILVKVAAVAQNPTDWKFVEFVQNHGTICGCDWAGNVVQVGKNVTTYAVGDHAAGFHQGGSYTDRGAFAEYVKVEPDLAWKVPPGALSHEEAATMGCAFWTAVQALFHPTRLGLVEPPKKAPGNEWIFIYGGSSSVGLYAIQLARIAGYKVVTVASPRNHEVLKSLGADAVFDYNDPDVIAKIKETTGDSLHVAFDTISVHDSQVLTVKTFAPGPGKLIVIQQPEEDAKKLNSKVTIQHTLIYTALGKELKLGNGYPALPDDRAHMAQFLTKVPGLASSGAIKPNPIKLWEGGLEAIPDGLLYMKEGKITGEKIVYRV
ncbi:GroES-like protein [Rhodofomes roseus]|uniref:GroES-like protein n=1 Tax=Rhodofomes roseus TaxID=34475 RepID=A0ABQ8KYI5_9APHY|nr:GroES-like protein [Rhodofomes roseus]KAH9844379.1 GroES-like protein [Rhodofomes roseus]